VQKQVDEEVAAQLARILAERDADTETTLMEAAASVIPINVPAANETPVPDSKEATATP
jgi:hypothetical protein